jgi:hypothetical protein
MNIVETETIGADDVSATNVPVLSDAPAWSESGSYDVGDVVVYQGARLYEALRPGGMVTPPELETTFAVSETFDYINALANTRSGYIGHGLTLHNIDTGAEIGLSAPSGHSADEFSPWHISDDASVAAFIMNDGAGGAKLVAYSLPAGAVVTTKNLTSQDSLLSGHVKVSPDGSQIAIGDITGSTSGVYDYQTLLIDTATGTTDATLADRFPMAWHPDGEYFICASTGDETVTLSRIRASDGAQRGALPTDYETTWVADFSPDGRYFAIAPYGFGATGKSIYLYDTQTWARTGQSLNSEIYAVTAANGYIAYEYYDRLADPSGYWLHIERINGTGGLEAFASFHINEGIDQSQTVDLRTGGNRFHFQDAATLLYASADRDEATRDDLYLQKRIIGASEPPDWTEAVVGAENARWLDLGATNPYRPFDDVVGTAAIGADTYSAATYNPAGETALTRGLAWQIEPGFSADSLIMLGLDGDSLDVRVMSAGGAELFGQRIDISSRARAAVFSIGLPVDGEIRISVAKASGDASVGNILIGTAEEIGTLEREGLNISGVDYSIVTETPQGALDLQPGNRTARNDYSIIVDNADATAIFERIGAIGGKKIAFVGSQSDQWALTIIYGVRERWSIKPWSATEMKLTMTVRGLV